MTGQQNLAGGQAPPINPESDGSVLHETARSERQRAMRSLLRYSLLTAKGEHSVEFGLVRRYSEELRCWLQHHANWNLQVTSDFARLRKIPPDTRDATRPARDERTETSFTRFRYILLCLALAALEKSERQTTLGKLVEEMDIFFASDQVLHEYGFVFDLHSSDQRRDLVQVIRFLIDLQILRRLQGDEDQFLKDEKSDALYNVHRPVLTSLLSVQKGPSVVTATGFDDRLNAITEELMPDSEESLNRQIRIRLMRRLLDDPVVYYAELTERERSYLDSQRPFMLRQILEATGMVAEVRKEGIALLDNRGDMSDLGLPEEGTDGHLTLLIAEFLAQELRREDAVVIGHARLNEHTSKLIDEHHRHWRKDVLVPGAAVGLTQMTLNRLAALRLVELTPDGVRPLPAIARYSLAEPVQEASADGGIL